MMKNMPKKFMQKPMAFTVLAFAVVGLMVWPAFEGHASKRDLMPYKDGEIVEGTENIVLSLGEAEVIDIEGGVTDVIVANPSIVDVMALQSDRLYLVGASFGSTNLLIVDREGEVLKRLNVHVKVNDEHLQRVVNDVFPDQDINIQAMHGQIFVTGMVDTPDTAARVQNFLTHVVGEMTDAQGAADNIISNLLRVRGEQQVMLRVRVLEVSRDILKEFGNTQMSITDIGGLLGGATGVTYARNAVAAIGTNFPANSGGLTEAGFGYLESTISKGAFGPIDIVLSALEEEGLANVLAEPNLTAVSGEQAGFLAGGEFPVPSGLDQQGNVVISYRDFGVSLNFRPTVVSEDRIMIQLETEVSSLNRAESVTLSSIEVPGLDIRRASTTVEMGSGGSLMIAGLLQSETVDSLSGLPGVNKTPVLGKLLSSENFRRQETELVVVVTPYLVKPFAVKAHAQEQVEKPVSPLSQAFSRNVREVFGKRADEAVEEEAGTDFGYILD